MDLWIEIAGPRLMRSCRALIFLILNDSEARRNDQRSKSDQSRTKDSQRRARYVAIRKANTARCCSARSPIFSCRPAHIHWKTSTIRLEQDTFAGSMASYLAGNVKGHVAFSDLRRAMIYGSVLASFSVEAFSMERLRSPNDKEIQERYEIFRTMSQIEVVT